MPKFILFAGTNGTGKTTLYETIKKTYRFGKRINTDEIVVKELNSRWNNLVAQFKAGRMALSLKGKLIKKKASFHQETTFTGKTIIKSVKELKDKGYKIIVHYVTVDSKNVAYQRVLSRTEQGGHYIEEDVVHKRYDESLRNLFENLELIDELTVYSNNTDFIQMDFNYYKGKVTTTTENMGGVSRKILDFIIESESTKVKKVRKAKPKEEFRKPKEEHAKKKAKEKDNEESKKKSTTANNKKKSTTANNKKKSKDKEKEEEPKKKPTKSNTKKKANNAGAKNKPSKEDVKTETKKDKKSKTKIENADSNKKSSKKVSQKERNKQQKSSNKDESKSEASHKTKKSANNDTKGNKQNKSKKTSKATVDNKTDDNKDSKSQNNKKNSAKKKKPAEISPRGKKMLNKTALPSDENAKKLKNRQNVE